jgi:hypothetical protein
LGHGVMPRDARGEILADSLAALRKLPRNSVQLEVRWVAERAERAYPAAGSLTSSPAAYPSIF